MAGCAQVLLCALPSLLSSSASSTSSLPTASSFLDVNPASVFDSSSTLLPSTDSTGALDWEFDWAGVGRPRARSSSRPSSSASTAVSHSHSQSSTSKMDVDQESESKSEWAKLEFDADEAALSDLGLGLGALDISFETRRAGDGSGRVRVRVHSSSSSSALSSSSLSSSTSMSFSSTSSSSRHTQQNRQNQLSLPTPSRDDPESDDEREDLGPFLTYTPSSASASRSSLRSHSMLEGLNFGLGLNSYNTFGVNDLMGVDTMGGLGMSMGMPFGTPDYGLDSATATQAVTQMRRRVRIALARLPHAGSEGGEWDVVEVAA